MVKNILIFADGTGNEGGLLPDESRTNVYKLYRAARCGPDSIIDRQTVGVYIPGIGTSTPRHDSRWNRLRETVQQGLGLGITKKVIDYYVAILGVWRPGDRIYLFGFSRGAYTARCVAHVLEVCGIPTKEKDGSSLNLDPKYLRKIANEASACLYIGGMPRQVERANKRIDNFRKTYAPELGLANGASAYLIGIWDTVAAIGWQRLFPDWTHDRHFCHDIRYARHLQSIDECRSDFKRSTGWSASSAKRFVKKAARKSILIFSSFIHHATA